VDGSAVFVIAQLEYKVKNASGTVPLSADLSSVPTLRFFNGNVLAFLLCSPHVSIQTRQVRATGNGNLTLGQPQRSQENIDSDQANYLLSKVFLDFTTNSGPSTSHDVGTDMMIRLIFGDNYTDYSNIPPAPLTNITAVYKQIIQSVMKTLLSGAIATENVPGGYVEEQRVVTSSLGYAITSAILFGLLMIALVGAQFRKGRKAFDFVGLAAALADSEVPQKCVEMMQGTGEREVWKLEWLWVPSNNGGEPYIRALTEE